MVVKELDPFPAGSAGDTFARAGRQAEEQMAFYLRRAFADRKDVYVLNGVRLERDGGDAAQIDHLIVHRGGMVIVESKSVHGRVRVNEHGEWVRVYGSKQQGMPSPIEQAKRQADFLRRYLNHHAPELTGKMLGLVQAYFGAMTVDVVVAISDTGIIDRPKKLPLPEVCKADQAHARIDEILARQRKDAGLLTGILTLSVNTGRELTRSEIEKILAFLPAHHRPYRPGKAEGTAATAPAPAPAPEPTPAPVSPAPLAAIGAAAAELSAPGGEVCAFCQKPLTPKVAAFCRDNPEKFGGQLYCFDHQRASKRRSSASPS